MAERDEKGRPFQKGDIISFAGVTYEVTQTGQLRGRVLEWPRPAHFTDFPFSWSTRGMDATLVTDAEDRTDLPTSTTENEQ